MLQAEDLLLSTVLVAPTSRSARPQIFRPTMVIEGMETKVRVEQTTAVAPERLGDFAGCVSRQELAGIDDALLLVFSLD